ncbi:MAG: PspA/IM30 family protein [Spirochaetaceae bacterium]
MGILKRVKGIYDANVNAMLDRAENPEVMINQIIRELEESVSDLKFSQADKVTKSKLLARQSEELKKVVTRWTERAELSVKDNKDDLAKEALKEKASAVSKLEEIDKDLERISTDVELGKEQILILQEKLTETLTKKKDLLSRAQRAEKKQTVNSVVTRSYGTEALEKFSRFESKVERMEAEAEIFAPTADMKFQDLESDTKIDEELKSLKSKLSSSKK